METVRFDIIRQPTSGWILTDSRRPARAFLSSVSAVTEAMRQVKTLSDTAAVIYVWEGGTERKVFDSRDPAP